MVLNARSDMNMIQYSPNPQALEFSTNVKVAGLLSGRLLVFSLKTNNQMSRKQKYLIMKLTVKR
jgi:hypothetical protein